MFLLLRGVLLSLAGSLALAAPVGAQVSLEVGPRFGYFRPSGELEFPAGFYRVGLPHRVSDLAGPTRGGAARMWVSRYVGFQVQGDVASGTVPLVATPVNDVGPFGTRVTSVGAQVLLAVLNRPDGYRLWLSGGAGMVRHGGEAYDFTGEGSTEATAGLIGIAGNVRMLRHVRVTASLNGLFHSYDLEMSAETLAHYVGSGTTYQRARRRDALATIGLEWSSR